MPNSEFLENYSLFQQFKMTILASLHHDIAKPDINMRCLRDSCKEHETRPFKMINEYYDTPACGLNMDDRIRAINAPSYSYEPYASKPNPSFIEVMNSKGAVVLAVYQCASCESFKRIFVLRFSPDLDYVIKIGQFPPWEISISKELENNLGDYKDLFHKGIVCESQSYGIGAFSYYRRIIEEIIDELLISIEELIQIQEKKDEYKKALEQIKTTKRTEDKIALVKDLLPDVLKPNGVNPLSELHSILSEGLHGKTDEECLENSVAIKNVLDFVIVKITQSKDTDKKFKDGIKKLLENKSKKGHKV